MHALLLSLALAASPWSAPSDASLDALVKRVHAQPLPARLARISARFVGAPYELGPLGEGAGHAPDPDPLWRWDAVDCVTFVEQALALAESPDLDTAERVLQRIRYAGETIGYAERNHLMESEWLPNNARKGFIRNVTREIAGDDAHYLWRRVDLPGAKREIAMAYLPLDKALAHQDQIPDGTLFFVARQWWHEVPDHVSHVGLLVRHNGRLYARHASGPRGRVVDEPFEHFLRDEARSGWRFPVLGLELAQPEEPDALTP